MIHFILSLALLTIPSAWCVDCSDDGQESLANGANDVIVALQNDELTYKATPFQVQIGKLTNWRTVFRSREGRNVRIFINGEPGPKAMKISETGSACFDRNDHKFTFTSDEWRRVPLRIGRNDGRYNVRSLDIDIHFKIYVYEQTARFIVTDVDGTITESDIRGHLYPRLGLEADHEGVVALLSRISQNKYNVIYVTARSMAQDDDTRKYLFEDLQDVDGHSLPFGPLLMAPKTFALAILEAATVTPQMTKFKILKSVFEIFDESENIVAGAYGNKYHDTAYLNSGIAPENIWVVNPDGVLRSVENNTTSSYGRQLANVNVMYPPIK